MSWLDFKGGWSWSDLESDHIADVHDRIRAFESCTVGELWNMARNKRIPVEKLAPEAQKRLGEIQRDDLDELWELGIDGKRRIWGHRERNVFHVIWWDPHHTVCPSNKKHT